MQEEKVFRYQTFVKKGKIKVFDTGIVGIWKYLFYFFFLKYRKNISNEPHYRKNTHNSDTQLQDESHTM